MLVWQGKAKKGTILLVIDDRKNDYLMGQNKNNEAIMLHIGAKMTWQH